VVGILQSHSAQFAHRSCRSGRVSPPFFVARHEDAWPRRSGLQPGRGPRRQRYVSRAAAPAPPRPRRNPTSPATSSHAFCASADCPCAGKKKQTVHDEEAPEIGSDGRSDRIGGNPGDVSTPLGSKSAGAADPGPVSTPNFMKEFHKKSLEEALKTRCATSSKDR
jgi:hypothetical protein